MPDANVCRHCGREIRGEPYLGDVNPEHVRDYIVEPEAPSIEILHPEGRVYDTFCSKEHYVRWLHHERHRLPEIPPEEDRGCPDEGL